jgi:hypothetical protein
MSDAISKALEVALIDLERVKASTAGETRNRVVWVIDGLRALFRQPTQPVPGGCQQLLEALIGLRAVISETRGEPAREAVQKADAAILAAQQAPQPVIDERVHILSILNGNIWHTEASENLKLAKDFELRLYADAALLSAAKGCAPRHQWDDGGERCVKCGDKDWFASVVCDESKLLSAAKGE